MVCWELTFTNLLIEGSVRRALQKALAGGDIYGMVEYKKRKPSTKKHFLSIVTCLKSILVFGRWESGVGLQMKIVRKSSHGYPADIRGVDGDDILRHSRS